MQLQIGDPLSFTFAPFKKNQLYEFNCCGFYGL